jgi:hypothetical protein
LATSKERIKLFSSFGRWDLILRMDFPAWQAHLFLSETICLVGGKKHASRQHLASPRTSFVCSSDYADGSFLSDTRVSRCLMLTSPPLSSSSPSYNNIDLTFCRFSNLAAAPAQLIPHHTVFVSTMKPKNTTHTDKSMPVGLFRLAPRLNIQ